MIERFHIHTEFSTNNHLNDNQAVFPNAVFDTLLEAHHQSPPPYPLPQQQTDPNTPIQDTTTTHNENQASLQKLHAPEDRVYPQISCDTYLSTYLIEVIPMCY